MLNKLLFERLTNHASSVLLSLFFLIQYILGENAWLDAYLPINGKPFVIVTMIALVVLGEALRVSYKYLYRQMQQQNTDTHRHIRVLQEQVKEDNLIQAVNRLHDKFLIQGASLFDDRLCVLELDTLIDIRIETKTNSFTQRKLEDMDKATKRD